MLRKPKQLKDSKGAKQPIEKRPKSTRNLVFGQGNTLTTGGAAGLLGMRN